MANSNRERDLVLAPNEFAYISDQTKGHIVAYVGPFKTSMANTDQPVIFDDTLKRFKMCTLEESIRTFTTVPEGWYVTLKNPPKDGKQPNLGTANSMPALEIGRKVNIPGPAFFALWPGQMVKVIKGHRLRTNQYLLIRVYEEEQAKKNWNNAVIAPQKDAKASASTTEVLPESEIPNLTVGKLLVIKGQHVAFYIPPTGIEVVPDDNGEYVREAVTLERLEYCILLDENGNKRYLKGPDVVIPEPTEAFFEKDGQRKFRAIELSETSGIYVKVISPYSDGKKQYNVGDELFITGKEQMIYFPRPEHALIKDGSQETYEALAIPPGEGRYYLNRKTGQISLQKGPSMFLPDPREAVIVQRILSRKQAELWFPGNKEVQEVNEKLSQVASMRSKGQTQDFVQTSELKEKADKKQVAKLSMVSEEFVRSQNYTTARTITLDTKYQGAVTVEVWTGYAVLITGKTGTRKVIVGPQTYQLEYDENLSIVELSTGTPKTDDNTIKTVYLRVLHNKVSDKVTCETKDLCPVEITLSYRINFTGEPDKWFNVENYVKFLTDHLRSKIRNAIQKQSITEFYSNGIDIIRNIVLGKAVGEGHRPGGKFEENGMHIYDVEVLDIEIVDEELESLLMEAQHNEVKQKLEISSKENELKYTQQTEKVNRTIAVEKSETKQQNFDLQLKESEKMLLVALSKIESEIKSREKTLQGKLDEQERLNNISQNELGREKASRQQNLDFAQAELRQRLEQLQADVQAVVQKAKAVSPDLVAALQAFSDRALAERMAQSMAPLSILGGKSVAEVFANLLKGTPLEYVLQKSADDQKSIGN